MVGAGFAAATHPAWWVVAGCGLTVALVGLLSTGPWAVRTADRVGRTPFDEPAPAAA